MAHSGSINALLATNFAGRIFRSLGLRPVRLSWDVKEKTVTITGTDSNGEVIVSTPIDRIDRAYFANGSYFIRIDGRLYDLQIQHHVGQPAVAQDAIDALSYGLSSVVADSRSDIEELAAFINESSTQKKVTRSLVDSKTYKKFLVGAAILAGAMIILSITFVLYTIATNIF